MSHPSQLTPMFRWLAVGASLVAVLACGPTGDPAEGGRPRDEDPTKSDTSITQPSPERESASPEASGEPEPEPKPTSFAVPADLELTDAPGVSLQPGTLVTVREGQIDVDETKVMALEAGRAMADQRDEHVLTPLLETLTKSSAQRTLEAKQAGSEWDRRLNIMIDADVPFETLYAVVATGIRSDHVHFSFITTHNGAQVQIPVDVPEFGELAKAASKPQGWVLSVELMTDKLSIARGASGPAGREYAKVDDVGAVMQAAQSVFENNIWARATAISAAPDVRSYDVLSVMAAARGPSCDEAKKHCLLSEVVLLEDNAHEYAPPGRTDVPAGGDEVWGGLPEVPRDGPPPEDTSIPVPPPPREVDVELAKVKVSGSLDHKLASKILEIHSNQVASCYRSALERDPSIKGQLEIDLEIGTSGQATSVSVTKALKDDVDLGNCVATASKRWKFPSPNPPGPVTVSVRYGLSPSE